MALESIPPRKTPERIVFGWYDLLKSVLSVNVIPRNVSGFVANQLSSLGRSSRRFLNSHFMSLKFIRDTFSISMEAPSGMSADYTLKLPDSLPASAGNHIAQVDDTGQMSFLDLEDTLDASGPDFSLADGVLPKSKLDASLGEQLDVITDIGTVSDTFQPLGDPISLTTSGRPVFLGFIAHDGSSLSWFEQADFILLRVIFKRGSTEIARLACDLDPIMTIANFHHIDCPPAGTYDYSVEVSKGSGTDTSDSFNFNNIQLIVFELT